MADDNNLNELQDLMRQVATSTKSMADSLQKQSSLQEKLVLNNNAKEEAKKAEEYHKEQQKKLFKLGEFGEEQKAVDEQSLDVLKNMLKTQEESNKQSASTTEYLQTLAKLTKQNKDELINLTNANVKSKGFLGGTATTLSKIRDVSDKANMQTGLSGIGSAAGLGASLIKIGKMGASGVGDLATRGRRKRIANGTQDINDFKVGMSAEKFELEQAEKSGDKDRIKKAQGRIKDSQGILKEKGTTLSKDLTSEYMRQQRKSNPNALKGMDSKTLDLIRKQQESNILSSVMGDSKGLVGNIDKKGNSEKNGGYSSPEAAQKAKMMSESRKSLSGSKGGIQAKFQAGEAQERQNEKLGGLILDTGISPSSSPSTYGEYVASTHSELVNLNTGLGKLLEGQTEVAKEKKGGGKSWFGKMLSGILGGIATMSKKLWGGIKTGAKFIGSNLMKGVKFLGSKIMKGIRFLGPQLLKGVKFLGSNVMKGISRIGPMLMKGLRFVGPMLLRGVMSLGPLLASVGTTLVSTLTTAVGGLLSAGAAGIATAVGGVIAAALGGLAIGDWIADKLGFDDGLRVTDLVAGGKSLLTGDGFSKGLEDNQIERMNEKRAEESGVKNIEANQGGKPLLKSTETAKTSEKAAMLSKSTFTPSATATAMSQIDSNKITEFQMLAKMIAYENVKSMSSTAYQETIKRELQFAARQNADAFK